MVDPFRAPVEARRSLLQRRPGHAVMTELLRRMEVEGSSSSLVPHEHRAWFDGAVGEVIVGQELARLPEEWIVLHAVPRGPVADIDHLVVGPGGIFVLNTKHHAGAKISVGRSVVFVRGHSQTRYQRDLQRSTDLVRELTRSLGVADQDVHPMLVFVAASSLAVDDGAVVGATTAARLVDSLLARDPVLHDAQVRALGQKLSRPAAWGRPDTVLLEADPTPHFLALRLPETVTLQTPVRASHRASAQRAFRVGRAAPPLRRGGSRPTASPVPALIRVVVAATALVALPTATVAAVGVVAAVVQALLRR